MLKESEPFDEEVYELREEDECPTRNRRKPCPPPSCPPECPEPCPCPEPDPCCPEEGCNIFFTKRCCALERRLASESFEDLSMLRSPAYLECFSEIIAPEAKCEPAEDC